MNPSGFTVFETPIGACALVWAGSGVIGAYLPERDPTALRTRLGRRFGSLPESAPPAAIVSVIERIGRLLRGEPDDLQDVELDMARVPDFNRRVYAIARAIRPGTTRTYGEIAAELGMPQAAREVGQALGANPFPIIVPCHRVLAAGGRSGGFSAPGGTLTKLRLLEIERAPLGGTPGLFD